MAELGLKLGLIVMVLVLGGVALAQTAPPAVVALTPAEMKWQSQGGLAAPGMEQINLVGDPAKPGPYTLRLKFPKGFRIEAALASRLRARSRSCRGHSPPAMAKSSIPPN